MLRALSAVALLIAAAPAPDEAAPVTLTLTGVKAKGGTMLVSLYDEKTFLRARPPFLAEVPVRTAGPLTVTFRKVPAGDYAIAALHDQDDDRRMGVGADGRMAEGTAMSNADKLRAAPTFAATKVAVAPGTRLTLPMSYPEDRSGW